MIMLLVSQLAFAHVFPTPIMEANCDELTAISSGPAQVPDYTDIEVRLNGNVYQLGMFSPVTGAHRTALIQWESGVRQHVARFANGEIWSVTGNQQKGLTLQVSNYFTNCRPLAPPVTPPSQAEIDRIWEAVREVAGGCGAGLVKD